MATLIGEVMCVDSFGEHKMVYEQWGNPSNPNVLVCIHGLTRNRHDFDFLADSLKQDYRIICPDIAGRGDSDWLLHPMDYTFSLYVNDILTLLESLNVEVITLLGTSMGGIIGMLLTVLPNSPIRCLILNDVGARLSKGGLERIKSKLVLNTLPRFSNLFEVEQHFRKEYTTFGRLSDAHWQHLACHSARLTEKGDYMFAYDPSVALPFQGVIEEIELWSAWEAITCPVLLLRGENSDLLLPETIARMQTTHPTMQVISLKDVGHAPLLMRDDEIQPIKSWLLRDS